MKFREIRVKVDGGCHFVFRVFSSINISTRENPHMDKTAEAIFLLRTVGNDIVGNQQLITLRLLSTHDEWVDIST